MDNKSLIGKWAAYFLDGDCCSGYGKIVGVNCIGFIEVEEHPGGSYKTGVPRCNIKDFDTCEEAASRFHADDEKRNEIRMQNLWNK